MTTDTRLSALLRSHAADPSERTAHALLWERVRLAAPGARGTCATCEGKGRTLVRSIPSPHRTEHLGYTLSTDIHGPCTDCTAHPGEVATLACGECEGAGRWQREGWPVCRCSPCYGTGIACWPERARLLAYAGDPGAREVLGNGPRLHDFNQRPLLAQTRLSVWAKGLASFGRITAVRAAYAAGLLVHERDLACACMGDVETCAALDALQTALAWARCPCERHWEACERIFTTVHEQGGLPVWAHAPAGIAWNSNADVDLPIGLRSAHQALGGTPEAAQQIRDAVLAHMQEWLT